MDCMYLAADGNTEFHLATGRSGEHIVQGIDMGGVVAPESFENLDKLDKNLPYFVLEYWAGNFTDWGFDDNRHIPDNNIKESMNNFVDVGASFNVYMLFGGSNFGFTNGAQGDLHYLKYSYNPVVTSYDYDAAVTEWGGYTQRYFDIKDAMERDHGM